MHDVIIILFTAFFHGNDNKKRRDKFENDKIKILLSLHTSLAPSILSVLYRWVLDKGSFQHKLHLLPRYIIIDGAGPNHTHPKIHNGLLNYTSPNTTSIWFTSWYTKFTQVAPLHIRYCLLFFTPLTWTPLVTYPPPATEKFFLPGTNSKFLENRYLSLFAWKRLSVFGAGGRGKIW